MELVIPALPNCPKMKAYQAGIYCSSIRQSKGAVMIWALDSSLKAHNVRSKLCQLE
jgi:hypothetical protein